MLYENVLLQTFDNKYNELLVKQETARKNIATMIYCFYDNNKSAINDFIKAYMLDSSVHDVKAWNPLVKKMVSVPDGSNQIGMFTEESVRIMPKIHIDLVNKVLDLVCTIYNAGADRYLLNEAGEIQDEPSKQLQEIYAKAKIEKSIIEQYKQGYLFNTILIQPVPRNGHIELDIITPNFCSVITDDNDYTKLKAVLIQKSIDNEDVVVYWSDTEHYYVDYKGIKKPVKYDDETDNGMKNPFGILPFAVLRFGCALDFWGEPQQDLVENNIWYNVRLMNNFFVEMFQGLGVGVGVNLGKNGVISISPNTIINSDNVSVDQVTPSLNFVSTQAPLTELRESLDHMYKQIGNSKGLSSQSMSNEVDNQSGISKAYDSAELQIKKDSHKVIMKQYERDELFEKIKLVHNYYFEDNKIDENLLFKIDIIEDEPVINVSDEIAITEFKLDKNMISILDLMIKNNPDITEEEAMKQLQENKIINEKYLTHETTKEKTSGESNGRTDSGSNVKENGA